MKFTIKIFHINYFKKLLLKFVQKEILPILAKDYPPIHLLFFQEFSSHSLPKAAQR